MIEYHFGSEGIDMIQVCKLYKMAGWWNEDCSSEQIELLIAKSLCFITAWNKGQIVGMGRIISDAFSDAYIQDVFVDENYRKQGIGFKLVDHLVNFCRDKNINWIALIAAPGSVSIYEKLGFEIMKGYTPMILKKNNDITF